MRLLVRHATTGDTIIDERKADLSRLRGWELLLKIGQATQVASPFEWRVLVRSEELDPMVTLEQSLQER